MMSDSFNKEKRIHLGFQALGRDVWYQMNENGGSGNSGDVSLQGQKSQYRHIVTGMFRFVSH